MKLIFLWLIVWAQGEGGEAFFLPSAPVTSRSNKRLLLQSSVVDDKQDGEGGGVVAALEEQQQQQQQFDRFHEIATKLRTSIHGNGFDSCDPKYGVENVYVDIPVCFNEGLGLELVEIAHSTTHPNRGLVVVSGIFGNAAKYTSIQEGDTIVSVAACNNDDGVVANFKKLSTAGLDYDSTVDAIIQAKTRAEKELLVVGGGDSANVVSVSISLQLNRLVRRAPVQVIVENKNDDHLGGKEETTTKVIIECLAGDNLRLVLKRHNVYNNCGNDCGGEGICGSDIIEILEGEDSVKYLKTTSSSSATSKDSNGRRRIKACQTIVGATNEPSTIRVRLC